MLEFLVTSKTRRRLLLLLWGERRAGSVSELADEAGVAFAGAHKELKAMASAGLAVVTRNAGKDVYSANLEHPAAEVLTQLATAVEPRPQVTPDVEKARRWLKALGAPLHAVALPHDATETLAAGLRLARRDASVAKSLPLCFWSAREDLDPAALRKMLATPEEKHTAGFFLALSGQLGGSEKLEGWADMFRDRRVRSTRDFFVGSGAKRRRNLSRSREFDLAERWGFLMNMDLDSFKSHFEKFRTTVE